MHDWIKKYGDTGSQHQTITGQQDELRQLKAQLRRVTEERDILKEDYFPGGLPIGYVDARRVL
jgi:transposase